MRDVSMFTYIFVSSCATATSAFLRCVTISPCDFPFGGGKETRALTNSLRTCSEFAHGHSIILV